MVLDRTWVRTMRRARLQERVEKLEVAVGDLRRTVHRLDRVLAGGSLNIARGEQPRAAAARATLTDQSSQPVREMSSGTPMEPFQQMDETYPETKPPRTEAP